MAFGVVVALFFAPGPGLFTPLINLELVRVLAHACIFLPLIIAPILRYLAVASPTIVASSTLNVSIIEFTRINVNVWRTLTKQESLAFWMGVTFLLAIVSGIVSYSFKKVSPRLIAEALTPHILMFRHRLRFFSYSGEA